jgi:cysteine-rich repeat protein
MSLQDKITSIKNKKGISIMVGYVLLVVFAVIMGAIIYTWIRSYVPVQPLECDEGVSIFIQDAYHDCDADQLVLNIKNNGRFSLSGYFLHAADTIGQEVATIDLSEYVESGYGGVQKFGSSLVYLSSEENKIEPGNIAGTRFNIPEDLNIELIQITPTRFQEEDNRRRYVSCTNAKVEQIIGCGLPGEEPGVPGECDQDCTGRECGTDPICGLVCPPGCSGEEVCNAGGQCVLPGECTDNCNSLGAECGSVCEDVCGFCTIEGEKCVAGECVDAEGDSYCGNGFREGLEQCDDGNIFLDDICIIDPVNDYMCRNAFCGDGYVCDHTDCDVIRGGPGLEQCDDGNNIDGDGCDSSCSAEWLVFVSSNEYDGYLNGVDGANILCNDLATDAGLYVNFVAFLSTDVQNAESIIQDGIYLRMDREIIANDKSDLLDGELLIPINMDEKGDTVTTGSGEVFTGTNKFGMRAVGSSSEVNCNNWADQAVGGLNAVKGDLSLTTGDWTNYDGADPRCNQVSRIYCFQIPFN